MNSHVEQRPTLRQVVDAALHQIATYRVPRLDEVSERLDELLRAAGYGGIAGEEFSLHAEGPFLRIDTSWVEGGRSGVWSVRLPSAVIDAEDPVEAARFWGPEDRVAELEARVGRIRADLAASEDLLARAHLDAVVTRAKGCLA